MNWLDSLLQTPPGQLVILVAIGLVYALVLSLKNEGRRDKLQRDLSASVNATNTALLAHFQANDAARVKSDAIIHANTAEMVSMVQAQGETRASINTMVEAVNKSATNTADALQKFGEIVTSKISDLLAAYAAQSDLSTRTTNQLIDVVSILHDDVVATNDHVRHILKSVNPDAVKPGWIDYEVHRIVGVSIPTLVMNACDQNLHTLLGRTTDEMKGFSPLQLAGELYDLNNHPLMPTRSPCYRAMLGEETTASLEYRSKKTGKSHFVVVNASPKKIDGNIIGVRVTYSPIGEEIRETRAAIKRNGFTTPPLQLPSGQGV